MSSPLTSAALANYEASLRADAETGDGMAHVPALEVAEVFAELREMRAQCATPMPYSMVDYAPTYDGMLVGWSGAIAWPHDAIGYGAALIRAGRAAKEGV